jgi:hypothetical protein
MHTYKHHIETVLKLDLKNANLTILSCKKARSKRKMQQIKLGREMNTLFVLTALWDT